MLPQDALPLNPKTFLLLLVLAEHGPPGARWLRAPSGSPADETDERRQYIAITKWGRAVVAAESKRIASLARLPAVQALAREAR